MHVPSNYPEGMTGRGIVASRTVPFFSRYEAIMRCCCSTPGLLSAFHTTTGRDCRRGFGLRLFCDLGLGGDQEASAEAACA